MYTQNDDAIINQGDRTGDDSRRGENESLVGWLGLRVLGLVFKGYKRQYARH